MNNQKFRSGSRRVSFRYDILRGLVKNGEADCPSCSIKYDSESTIKRTASFTLSSAPGIDFLKDKLRAIMIIDGEEFPVGTFVLSTPSLNQTAAGGSYSVEAYDTTIILKEDCFTERAYFEAGRKYSDVIGEIVLSAGITDYSIPQTVAVLPADREFELGKSKLEACNELLDEINYNPLIADETGRITTSKYVKPSAALISHEYYDDELSVISPELESEEDYYNVPNVFIAKCDNPELKQEYYSVYTNDNPGSKLSTVARGRRIVSEIYQPDYVESQEALDEYISRKAAEASAVFDKCSIKTALMPGHGYRDIVRIRCKGAAGIYVEKSWSLELRAGALMSHELVGVYQV